MALSSNTINLSELPLPDVIKIPDPDTLFTEWISRLQSLDSEFNALVESDPAFKQGEIISYQSALFMQRVNDAVRAVFLASAAGSDLDQLGAGMDVARLLIRPADLEVVPPVPALYESDTAFRARVQLSWAKMSTAGAGNSYRYYARSAHPDVLDAEAYGPETHGRPGEVEVYLLSRSEGGEASPELLMQVASILNEDEVRPLTDYVKVLPAKLAKYEVLAELEIPAGPDAGTVLRAGIDELKSYTDQMQRIGAILSLSGIYKALHQPGVTRVHLLKPTADLECGPGIAPLCQLINVTRKGGSSGIQVFASA